jgi:hypothetical protein
MQQPGPITGTESSPPPPACLPLPEQLGADIIWRLYQEALKGDPGEVADGSRRRTLGGKFFRLAKQAKGRWAQID